MSAIDAIEINSLSRSFSTLDAHYVTSPLAAAFAMTLVFRDMTAKTALQRGLSIPTITFFDGLKGGIKTAPIVGAIVGSQMVALNIFENIYFENSNKASLSKTLVSSAIVSIVSSPFSAVYNGHTMGWSLVKSARNFSSGQCLAITFQTTALIASLKTTDRIAYLVKDRLGHYRIVDYLVAFTAGYIGSLIGHPANTALTRWQNGLKVDSFHQSMWGAARKARAVGFFSVFYKIGKETLNSFIDVR